MGSVVTGPEATEYAARITAAITDIGEAPHDDDPSTDYRDADLRRVTSDLAGYLRALDALVGMRAGHRSCVSTSHGCVSCRRYFKWRDDHLAALIETGALYGVTP